MVLDIKNLETDRRTRANLMIRTKNRILAIIRSNEGLDKVALNQFIIRHTNKDVHLAYFKINKEVEKVIRAYVDK
jgi:predicted HicB family RNase H-like nuclease